MYIAIGVFGGKATYIISYTVTHNNTMNLSLLNNNICVKLQAHFTDADYELNRRDGRKLLKRQDVVPSIFPHKCSQAQRSRPRSQRLKQSDTTDSVVCDAAMTTPSDHNYSTATIAAQSTSTGVI